MFTEKRQPEDVRAGDEVFLPHKRTWALVQTISAPDDNNVVWMTFTDEDTHGFTTNVVVSVRRPVPAPGALPPPQPAPASVEVARPTPVQRPLAPAPPQPTAPASVQWGSVATAEPVPAPVPLTYMEHYELARLCSAALSSTKPPGTTDREDLDRLRGALRIELDRLRVTTAYFPCSAGVDPINELIWRRGLVPLVEEKARAEQEAQAEAARREEAAREETARCELEKAEEQRRWSTWMATQHATLSPAEQKWQDLLREEMARGPFSTAENEGESERELKWSTPGDCGRMHWSNTAAYACANVRAEEAQEASRPLAPPPIANPMRRTSTSSSSTPAPQAPPVQSAAPPPPTRTPPTPTRATPTRPAPQAYLFGLPQPDRPRVEREPMPAKVPPTPPLRAVSSRPSTTATSLPTPSPPRAPSAPVDYAARILTAVQQKPLKSARAVFQETGGNKPAVFESVKLMLDDGRLVTDSEGVYRVGSRARRGAV